MREKRRYRHIPKAQTAPCLMAFCLMACGVVLVSKQKK
nr:MAG TPA: hypothetical protein [Caudoviricetes sp.]